MPGGTNDDDDDVTIEQSSGESLKSDDSDTTGEELGVGGRDSGYDGQTGCSNDIEDDEDHGEELERWAGMDDDDEESKIKYGGVDSLYGESESSENENIEGKE